MHLFRIGKTYPICPELYSTNRDGLQMADDGSITEDIAIPWEELGLVGQIPDIRCQRGALSGYNR